MKYLAAVFALIFVFALTGCTSVTKEVDSKDVLPVPNSTVNCYFVEIETKDGEEEISEENKCVTKEVYDKQTEGQPFVP